MGMRKEEEVVDVLKEERVLAGLGRLQAFHTSPLVGAKNEASW